MHTLGLRLNAIHPAGCAPVYAGACLNKCVLVGMHLCFFSAIGVHACLCMCRFTLTTSFPHAHVPPLLPFVAPSTVSALRSRRAQSRDFPLLPRHIPRSPTSDMAALSTIGARQRRLCLSSCSPLPAPCSDKTSRLAAHPHNTLACHNTSLPPLSRPRPCTS